MIFHGYVNVYQRVLFPKNVPKHQPDREHLPFLWGSKLPRAQDPSHTSQAFGIPFAGAASKKHLVLATGKSWYPLVI